MTGFRYANDGTGREEALAWFLAGFGVAGEGYNPDVLVDWDDPDRRPTEAFEEMWPEPEHESKVTTAEEQVKFDREVRKAGGLFDLLPKRPAGLSRSDGGPALPATPVCPSCGGSATHAAGVDEPDQPLARDPFPEYYCRRCRSTFDLKTPEGPP